MNEKRKFTIADFIERLKLLPQNLPINGYIYQTDDGEVRNTYEMGEIIPPSNEEE